MKRRTQLGAVLAVAVLAAVAGCDSGTTPSGSKKPLEGQTVEVAATWTGTEQANFKKVLAAFTTKTGAEAKYTSGGNDLPTLINSRLAGGSPPDIALISQPGYVAELVKKGSLKELTGGAADAISANYSGAWKDLGTVNGKLYGVYFKVANKSLVWHRTDKFADAGVQPPATWEDFVKLSKTLVDAGITPMAVPGADGWTLTDWFENIYLRVGGSENYDKLSKHQLAWTDPTVVETLKTLGEYWAMPKVVEGGSAGALQLQFTQSVADVFGEKPKSAMLMEGDFVGAEVTKLGKVKVGDGAKFFDFPSIKGSKPAVVTAGDQAVAFKDTKAAMALIEFLASPEAAAIMAAGGGYLSANKNLATSSYPDPTMQALAKSVVNAELLRFDLSDLTPAAFGGGSNASMWKLLQQYLGSPTNPESLAQKLEEAAKKDFGSN
jgi:alpha-glucoside transport system substrate-binding protein